VREARTLLIAAEYVHVRSVPKSNDRRISAATKLARDKELTCVPSRRFISTVMLLEWHMNLAFQIYCDFGELREASQLTGQAPFTSLTNAIN
jgi:hypothetical protein